MCDAGIQGYKDNMITRFKDILMIAGLLMILGSCGEGEKGTASIEGRFEGGADLKLKLEELDPMGTVPIDSLATGRDGSFRFAISPKEPGFYIVKTGDNRMTVVTVAPGDTVQLSCNAADFPGKVGISGPEDARLLGEFFAFSSRQKARSDSLQEVLDLHRGDSLFVALTLKADTIFKQIWNEQRAYETSFLEQHPTSFAALIVVNYSFGVRPVLSMDEDMAWYKRVDSALAARFPGNRHVVYLTRRISEFEREAELNEAAKR